MATLIVKRSVVLDGARTSVSLENKFWDGLQEIARSENLTNSALAARKKPVHWPAPGSEIEDQLNRSVRDLLHKRMVGAVLDFCDEIPKLRKALESGAGALHQTNRF